MSDDKKKKKSGPLDKLMMGMIVGGAIGSVLGMGIAPKKGKDTRKFLKKGAKELIEKGRNFLEEHEEEIEAVKQSTERQSKKLFQFIHSTQEQNQEVEADDLRKIPHEE